MRSMFLTNLRTSGKPFSILRTSLTVKGIPSLDSRGTYIAFGNDVDIHSNDWVTNSVGERLYITHIEPIMNYKNCYYITEYEYNRTKPSSPSFNIQADKIENSIIGTQTNASISLNNQLEKMKSDIAQSDSSEKEELLKIVSLLEEIKINQQPVPKGFLSNFSSIMEKNSWISSSISSFLLSLFLNP